MISDSKPNSLKRLERLERFERLEPAVSSPPSARAGFSLVVELSPGELRKKGRAALTPDP